MKKLILSLLILSLIWASPVRAQWDDDVWVEHQRLENTDWNSTLELEVFLALQEDKPITVIAGVGGLIKFRDIDCEDYALKLRNTARLWGRYLDIEILTPQEYRQYYGKSLPANSYHAINKAIIGNEWWLVDLKENKVWHYMNLD